MFIDDKNEKMIVKEKNGQQMEDASLDEIEEYTM